MPQGPVVDYYALLGIETNADDDDIRRAWRKAALECHPDRAGPDATERFQLISIAYEVLSDPAERAAYDLRNGTWRRRVERPPEAPIGRRAPGVMLRRLCGPMNALLARGVARFVADDLIDLVLEPQELEEGGMITISMRVPVRCAACATSPTTSCPQCGGTRTVEELYSAWLAVRPGATEGTILTPSARLPDMIHPVSFRIRLH
ncbi:MAG TPA: DnaJ domain-containing protein [Kofleriaceae bacterium]